MISCPSLSLTASFLVKHGLFVRPGFLDSDTCRTLRKEMDTSVRTSQGAILSKNGDHEVDATYRQVNDRKVSPGAIDMVKKKLKGIQAQLEEHFEVTLTRFQTPRFLFYQEGDFYQPHKDNSNQVDAPSFMKDRKVSIVIFLNNEEIPLRNNYTGGALAFYGLGNDPRTEKIGFPLHGEEGLLVAFPSHLRHEVTKVTGGKRYTVVSWAD